MLAVIATFVAALAIGWWAILVFLLLSVVIQTALDKPPREGEGSGLQSEREPPRLDKGASGNASTADPPRKLDGNPETTTFVLFVVAMLAAMALVSMFVKAESKTPDCHPAAKGDRFVDRMRMTFPEVYGAVSDVDVYRSVAADQGLRTTPLEFAIQVGDLCPGDELR